MGNTESRKNKPSVLGVLELSYVFPRARCEGVAHEVVWARLHALEGDPNRRRYDVVAIRGSRPTLMDSMSCLWKCRFQLIAY